MEQTPTVALGNGTHRFFDQCDLDRCHFPRSVEELARLLSTADTRRTIRCDGPLLQKAG